MAVISAKRKLIENIVSGLMGRLKHRKLMPAARGHAGHEQTNENWQRWFGSTSVEDDSVTFEGGEDGDMAVWAFSRSVSAGDVYTLSYYAPETQVPPTHGPIYTFNGEDHELDFLHVELCYAGIQILLDALLARFPELQEDYDAIDRAAVPSKSSN